MPTNLPPDYFEVERRYKAASTPADKVACLEELIATIPKHKGTDHLRADLRRRLSKLRAAAQTKKKTSRRESAFQIDREGAGQAVLAGPTNVGKSALVNALTSASPEVSAVPYTTWTPMPGMMLVDNVQIQLVDTPPLNPDYVEPELMNLIRRADLLLLVIDLLGDPFQQIEDSVAFLREHRIVPLRLRDHTEDTDRVTFLPVLVLVNKCDDETLDEDFEICCELVDQDWPLIPVSAETGRNLERMKRAVFDRLGIIRIFSKAPGGEPDYTSPFVMPIGGTVEEFARKIHQDFYLNLKAARVWGSATFDGQLVGRDHVLHDGDVVELRI